MGFLLDVVADTDVVRNNMGIILFMAMCILSEAAVIRQLKTAANFKNALLYSALVNTATLLCGFFLVPVIEKQLPGKPEIYLILICFLLSVVIEGLLLKPLVKDTNWKKIFTTSFLMNLTSYAILLLVLLVKH